MTHSLRRPFRALALGATALTLSLAANPLWAQSPVGLGTMAPGTLSYSTGVAIAEVMVGDLEIEARVQPNAGESTLLALLSEGQLDFVIANSPELAGAVQGTGPFAGRPAENLRVAAVLHPLQVGLFVREDSEIRTIGDLRGRTVTAGFAASPAIALLLDAALAAGGMTQADITPVPVPDLVSGADRFAEGRVDAFFFALGAGKVLEIDAGTRLRLVALADDDAARAGVSGVFADAYIATARPRPGLVGVAGETPVLAFDNLLVTRADVPDDVVARVVAGLAENRDALAERFAPLAAMDPDRLYKPELHAPYHPATVAWNESR